SKQKGRQAEAVHDSSLIPETDDGPASLAGNGFQAFVRIDSDRVIDHFQQRQIVMRVTVEPAAGQIKTLLGQPVLQTDDFTVLKTGSPGNFAGIATVNKFRMRGNNMLNSQQLGYGIGHKTVGGRDNQQGITEALVMSDQVTAFLRNQRYYPFLQKGLAGVQHLFQ